jgi:hypothetical protein
MATAAQQLRDRIAEAHSGRPRITLQDPTPVIARPPNPRLQIPCPACSAQAGQRCTNYTGAYCAPHGARKPAPAPKTLKYTDGQPYTDPSPQPDKVSEVSETSETSLDAAVEALVARYTCGAVIDAAWAAGAKLHPWKGRTA